MRPKVEPLGGKRHYCRVAVPMNPTSSQKFPGIHAGVTALTTTVERRVVTPPHLRWAMVLSLALFICVGCDSDVQPMSQSGGSAKGDEPTTSAHALDPDVVSTIKTFCGDCHPFPMPETFPKDHWEEEVVQGYDFYITSGRTDLEEPNRADTIRYYLDEAPEVVTVPRADDRPETTAGIRFERWQADITSAEQAISISHLIVGKDQSLLTADMRRGGIHRWSVGDEGIVASEIGKGNHSCRLTPCDLNADGVEDILVGEIGSYGVGDHSNGRVSVLLGSEQGQFQYVSLMKDLARVVECAPLDYDSDGDLDVLVAEFGWLETGSLKLLRNHSDAPGLMFSSDDLEVEVIDDRHGALGVTVVDINKDGHLDFVVAFGQEYESLEIWFGEGGGKYRHEIILELPDPSYNSSSFQVVDVDQDGHLDFVHTNGDTLDAFLPKPYHGVRWIRNRGDGTWERRELGLLIGALQAVVEDFDHDGDLDIAAVGMYPQASEDPGAYDSICWWEQTENTEFVQHSIERDHCDYATLVAHDVDGDGFKDLVLGNWSVGPGEPPLRVYRVVPN